jgi:hypothetical protein
LPLNVPLEISEARRLARSTGAAQERDRFEELDRDAGPGSFPKTPEQPIDNAAGLATVTRS